VENLWAVGAPARTPLGELTAPPDALAGEKVVAAPSQEPPPLSGFGPSVLAPVKNPGRALIIFVIIGTLEAAEEVMRASRFVGVSVYYRNN